MGFGLLFIGYFTAYIMSLNRWGVLFRIFGYILASFGIIKLSQYNRNFIYSLYASLSLALINCFTALSGVSAYLYDNLVISSNPFGDTFLSVIASIEMVMILVFHVLLLFAVRAIAKETEADKIVVASMRNLFFIGAYFVLYFVQYLPFGFIDSYKRNMGMPIFVLYLVCLVFNLILLFSCYSGICDENDVEMERKPSRFEFVNKYREELDARQEKAKREADEYRRQRKEQKNKK